MTNQGFIICDGLVKIYKVANLEVVALQGLDLTVDRGEMLGIVGASGSGKSTLMSILGGLDRPSAGRVIVAGNDLLKMSTEAINHFRRTKIGFVWQQGARNLIPYLSALENVRLPITITAQSWSKEKPRAEALLASVGLKERMHHRLAELSGGEQQRVAIAVALANNPVLLLADEPTGEVDTETAVGIYHILRDLNQQYGLTTIIVSHDVSIAHYVDRVVAIRDGKTSSETVRRAPLQTATAEQSTSAEGAGEEAQLRAGAGENAFQEVILLDSAGRLQVPHEFLEKFNIQGRVHLEAVDDGILIRPAAGSTAEQSLQNQVQEILAGPVARGEQSRVRRLWVHLRGGRRNRS